MNKKFTITLPWTYNSCNTDEDWFCIMATLYYVKDLLGSDIIDITTNEILDNKSYEVNLSAILLNSKSSISYISLVNS